MDQRTVVFNLSRLAVFTAALPLGAFLFCIGLSLIYNFNESTSTHCKVTNYLPSISASIGSFSPQKYVWRLAIGLHSSPRFLISYLHYLFWHNNPVALSFNFIEISSLIGLSFISSIENFRKFYFLFCLFITSNKICLIMNTYRKNSLSFHSSHSCQILHNVHSSLSRLHVHHTQTEQTSPSQTDSILLCTWQFLCRPICGLSLL